ncbi:MAG: hypothetical protein ACP5GC_07675 [Thiomonas sp.]|jgi:hypothetical protein
MSITHQALRRGALVGALATCLLSPSLSQAAQVHHVGTLSYACGGVGEGDLKALQAQAPHFNLGFWMVEGPRGAYLADVPIRIRHQGKTVAEFTADGPLCYVQAPAGSYTIEGTHRQQQRSVTVQTGNKNAYLRW